MSNIITLYSSSLLKQKEQQQGDSLAESPSVASPVSTSKKTTKRGRNIKDVVHTNSSK